MGGYISEAKLDLSKNIIFDNTQAFYKKPILSANTYNVYSARKFFGVPDGSYLIANKDNKIRNNYEKDISYSRALFLLKSLELGTNGAYKDNLQNEEMIGFKIKRMSNLTKTILNAVDYADVRKIRRDNFIYMHKQLASINKLNLILRDDDVPMIYPLLVENESFRDRIVKQRIYVPQWWKHCINEVKHNTIEEIFSKYLIPLPIDQRYTKNDIDEIVRIVKGQL